ncbi:MAG: citrulline utilization hydrolase CtlX [Candidatus Egerieousia sp.]
MQTTDKVLMVRPIRFAFNEETAGNNAFQQKAETEDAVLEIQRKAVEEFDSYVRLLRDNGVEVEVLQDTPEPFTPDSIFPNNCFSTHLEKDKDGKNLRTLVWYPMFANNRRLEREKLKNALDKEVFDKIIDLTPSEADGAFLEGTGSLILDREAKLAFCCASPRSSENVLERWAEKLDYEYFLFNAEDEEGTPIYHTNVMMHVGSDIAVVCLDSVTDIEERERLIELLEENGKEIVEISFEQMHSFAGNMLELKGKDEDGKPCKLLVMSATAKNSLTEEQLAQLEDKVRIVAPEISSIETAGGGSARCMLAEIF